MTEQSGIDNSVAEPKKFSRSEKISGFALGFLGWWPINTLLWIISYFIVMMWWGALFFPVIINIIVLIIMVFIWWRWRWIAFGALAAIGVNFLIALVQGLPVNFAIYSIPFFLSLGWN